MAPGVGRGIVDREVDLDKLRTAIGCGSEADNFHQGSPNGAPLGAGVAIRSQVRPPRQAVPPRGEESRDETWRRAALYRCRRWERSGRHTRIRADGRGDWLPGFGRA